MKRIILASGSPQRKKLLKLFGIIFSVRKSQVQEFKKITTTCSALVKKNAFLKAQDIAANVKNSLVIGADTVVYIGDKKIILKPRNFKEAKKILKILFSRPQWVYTGVAVIDAKSGKTLIDYEKTKVFMTPLTDKEIDKYHRKVHPFDKAGGFDIEGLGSIFIHRIEGDYANVVGLPLAKLHSMLKKFGVKILSLVLLINCVGCTTEYNLATRKQETYIYGTEKEVAIGEKVAAKIEKKYDILIDVDQNERAERILDEIVEVSDRSDLVYFIKIIDEEGINAVSLPGGFIYLFEGLMENIENDDQLAGVIAHEVGHITAKHGIKKLQASYGALILQIATVTADAHMAGGVNLALITLFTEYSQKAEFEADELGIKYMKKAGYDPKEMIKFLEIMKKEDDKKPLRKQSYWFTHPHIPERIANSNRVIRGRLDFRDYIRLIDSNY